MRSPQARAKARGASHEHYIHLTLEYNGYHVKKNYRSLGVEDVAAATNGKKNVWVQGKKLTGDANHNPKNAMTEDEKEIFRRHAKMYGCIPIYCYVDMNKKKIWIDLSKNKPFPIKPYTDHWYQNRQKIRRMLKDIKDPRKGGSKSKWCKYVLENWKDVGEFIC